MNSKIEKLYKKINNDDYIIIFGSKTCIYCKKALELLKDNNLNYKYYSMDNFYDLFFKVLIELSYNKPNLNINQGHKTIPVIFYKKKFIGGYTELLKIIKN